MAKVSSDMLRALLYNIFNELRLHFRVPLSLFWVFVFPLAQLFLFGALFGGDAGVHIRLGVIDHDRSMTSRTFLERLRKIEVLSIETAREMDPDALKSFSDKIEHNRLEGVVVIPKGFENDLIERKARLELFYHPSRGPINEILFSIMNEINQRMTAQLYREPPPITLDKKSLKTDLQDVQYISFLLPGLIGLVILSVAVFSVGITMTNAREEGYFKQLSLCPVPKWIHVVSFVSAGLLISLIQSGILMGAGILFYRIEIVGSVMELFLLTLLATLTFLSIGACIGSVAPTVVSANILANAVFFPFLFLSEVYFPISNLPDMITTILRYFPLLCFLDVFRRIMNEGGSLWSCHRELIVLVVWMIVPLWIAIKNFRWLPRSG